MKQEFSISDGQIHKAYAAARAIGFKEAGAYISSSEHWCRIDCEDKGLYGAWSCAVDAILRGQDKAKTFDDGKAPLACLPPEGMRAVARVQAYGHKKYGDFNNYRKGMEASRQASCIIRHVMAFMDGEDLDPESGESHIAHAACRAMFLLQNLKDGVMIDDRFKPENQKQNNETPSPHRAGP